jgi:hypothetical protein
VTVLKRRIISTIKFAPPPIRPQQPSPNDLHFLWLNRVDLRYYWSFNSHLPKNNIEYPQTGPPFEMEVIRWRLWRSYRWWCKFYLQSCYLVITDKIQLILYVYSELFIYFQEVVSVKKST